MSWERAGQHNCKNGRICYGHKVSVRYEKVEYMGKSMMSRIVTCDKCGESCESETISPHKEFRT